MRRKSYKDRAGCNECSFCYLVNACLWNVHSSVSSVNHYHNQDYEKVIKMKVQKKPLETFGQVDRD